MELIWPLLFIVVLLLGRDTTGEKPGWWQRFKDYNAGIAARHEIEQEPDVLRRKHMREALEDEG